MLSRFSSRLFQKCCQISKNDIKEQIYNFLASLNAKYDHIQVWTLGKVLIPSLEQTYSYIQQKECRRIVMLHIAQVEKGGLIV